MKPKMLTVSTEGVLRRSEMKMIMAGGCPSCAACANDCNSLYSGYYHECNSTYPDPSSDEQALCRQEVHELNGLCINDCFQVN